jgi:hypothetical protein
MVRKYIYQILFILFSVVSAGIGLFVVSDTTLKALFIILTFFSLVLAYNPDNLVVQYRDMHMEWGTTLSEGYDGLIEHANKNSSAAAERMSEVRYRSHSNEPFHELAQVIDTGIEYQDSTLPNMILSNLKLNIESKKYVEYFQDPSMKVVRFEQDRLYVDSSERKEFLKENMVFRIYTERVQLANESAESVSNQIGIAEVVLTSKNITEMRMRRWTTPLENPEIQSIRQNELKGKKVRAEILLPESIKNTPIEELEEAYQQLRPIRSDI